jgi:broad specificity phosphatase PhoE
LSLKRTYNNWAIAENRDIHQTVPDHRVKLTPEGWSQAHDAGRRLRSLLRADDTLHFFTSPYRRTRETTEGILSTLTSDSPEPSPFPRHSIKVYEEPRLREQDFGNFQPCSAEMERMWQERADYGHFFYRIPNGESAADAYDRISGFNESLWRQFGESDFASVCVLVTHGLMSRVFLMKWYHFSVEYFEDLRNVNHCEFLIMRRKEEGGKYVLENQLRTWSDLKRERHEAAEREGRNSRESRESEREKEKAAAASNALERAPEVIPKHRRWGGCPNGCDHGRAQSFRRERMLQNGKDAAGVPGMSPITSRPRAHRWQSSEDEDDDPRGRLTPKTAEGALSSSYKNDNIPSANACSDAPLRDPRPRIKSPAIRSIPLLQVGRDFGGSASGRNSRTNSDEEETESVDGSDEAEAYPPSSPDSGVKRLPLRGLLSASIAEARENGEGFGKKGPVSRNGGMHQRMDSSAMRIGTKADALGDQGDGDGSHDEKCGHDEAVIIRDEAAEAEERDRKELEKHSTEEQRRQDAHERSVRGSVY